MIFLSDPSQEEQAILESKRGWEAFWLGPLTRLSLDGLFMHLI